VYIQSSLNQCHQSFLQTVISVRSFFDFNGSAFASAASGKQATMRTITGMTINDFLTRVTKNHDGTLIIVGHFNDIITHKFDQSLIDIEAGLMPAGEGSTWA
jgi:hypothetical protein